MSAFLPISKIAPLIALLFAPGYQVVVSFLQGTHEVLGRTETISKKWMAIEW